MMVLEQLGTAGTLTEWALRKLHRKWSQKRFHDPYEADIEAAPSQLGDLEMYYYEPVASGNGSEDLQAPVKSHLKLTVVDNEIVVLGSGNMDRASWYTSQELGVAFFSRELAKEVMDGVNESLRGRLRNAVPAR
jgi:phosphatidylserine/phosphatidylglycerophosphate/cardiolipin synthase-like enzyme